MLGDPLERVGQAVDLVEAEREQRAPGARREALSQPIRGGVRDERHARQRAGRRALRRGVGIIVWHVDLHAARTPCTASVARTPPPARGAIVSAPRSPNAPCRRARTVVSPRPPPEAERRPTPSSSTKICNRVPPARRYLDPYFAARGFRRHAVADGVLDQRRDRQRRQPQRRAVGVELDGEAQASPKRRARMPLR